MLYRDFEINIDIDENVIYCPEIGAQAETVKAIKSAVDKHIKAQSEAAKTNVIFYSSYPDEVLTEGVATVVGGGGYIFVMSGGKRKKMHRDYLYLDTPQNRAVLAEAERMEHEASVMREAARKYRDENAKTL